MLLASLLPLLGLSTAPPANLSPDLVAAVCMQSSPACASTGRTELPAPQIDRKLLSASPTRSPWIIASGWRLQRDTTASFVYRQRPGGTLLSLAEAWVWQQSRTLINAPAPEQEQALRFLAFLSSLPRHNAPALADLRLDDDGSTLTGEALNLLSRRNLLWTTRPDRPTRLRIKPGSSDFPARLLRNPSEFAYAVRRQLQDENRSFRIYGSEVVLGSLQADERILRVHLVNYGERMIDGLTLRLPQGWRLQQAKSFHPSSGEFTVKATPLPPSGNVTELSIERVGLYTAIDLVR
jgi:hypothetical protein